MDREISTQIHIFQGGDGSYGFTPRAGGDNLPAENGLWRLFKSIMIYPDHPAPRIGVNEDDVLAAIGRQGYYILDAQTLFEKLAAR